MNQGLLVMIDDEEDLLDLLEYNFSRVGFEVKAFEEATSAWKFISQSKPDLILCDWMMPGMTGLEFCKKVKEDMKLADIPFVMFTCRGEQEAIANAYLVGVSDYIVKPVKISELVNRVQSLMTIKKRF